MTLSLLLGLIGAGIRPSLTPLLHEAEAAAHGLRCNYELFDLDALGGRSEIVGELVSSARMLGFDGLNVTHPCKQLVVEHLDELSPEAALLGAVNTVVLQDGRAVGHNTDGIGFARSLARGLPDASLERVVLLGAGGAGAAVAHALLSMGASELTIVDLDVDRAASLAAAAQGWFGGTVAAATQSELAATLRDADGLVHATPTGMAGHSGLPLPIELLRSELWIADIVYRPLQTALARAAAEAGCRVLTGGGMAVFQAAEAFRLFTGIPANTDRMLQTFAQLARNEMSGA
jgi:shikimate dehydrogenase